MFIKNGLVKLRYNIVLNECIKDEKTSKDKAMEFYKHCTV